MRRLPGADRIGQSVYEVEGRDDGVYPYEALATGTGGSGGVGGVTSSSTLLIHLTSLPSITGCTSRARSRFSYSALR